MKYLKFISLFVPFIHLTLAWEFALVDTYQGANFLSMFQFFSGADPTNGWVYVFPFSPRSLAS
jgi:hypothetical protein